MKKPLLLFLLSAAITSAQSDTFTTPLSRETPAGFRTWTSTVGTTVEAKFLSASEHRVRLQKLDGEVIEVPISALSPADQTFLGRGAGAKPEPKTAAPAPATPAAAPPLPADFPADETIQIIPLLKRKHTQPMTYAFTDAVSGRQVTSNQLRGKYVYVHTMAFFHLNTRQLQDLKLLHEKYAARGFEIISIHPHTYRGRTDDPRFSTSGVRATMRKAIEDYAITWLISFPPTEGKNPLLETVSDQTYINYLLDPEGRLIHTNIVSGGTTSAGSAQRTDFLSLARALKLIFGD